MALEDRPDIQKIKEFKKGAGKENLNLIGASVKWLDKEVKRLKKDAPYTFVFCVDGVLKSFLINAQKIDDVDIAANLPNDIA